MIAEAKTVDEIIGVVQSSLIRPVEGLLFALATLVFIYGVVEYMAGASNEEARTKGKTHMIWGLVGLFIMFSVSGIIAVLKNFFGVQ
ncbi:hypothetical protein A3I36_04715 [Candidatus Giovannonibacteria bacterium RIFCSPLOWO2_02_FULL_45_28]|uniref:DUF4134 domain-containing protein n=2 Tax=Candidatus Giovannoniibacteriota TaxID=1752738 RepID=A0A1F5WAY7_9BACT|nr:MAG: hypothetical protein UW15_C0020G0007 [Parcubacteria group bacterium GW2011_GWC1_44_10]KKT59415.1 MAG: hypothetical protein UW53_C0013G0016 [Candidatus Giovannonibacteria bacterium GW2011_GWA1_44_25]KKU29532.1 MAG: hypothetical protein UX43_C0010G0016 [Candidatus Giovannonibacteria bacterium GW2011_GWB1_46_20]OGF49111.1 MAG: hypothetical protein A2120_04840 [Candidatus Giovannonibacteria bacterium GWA2_45_15]OGF60549.1 MAG: hypothetical protein A2W40_02960 [Candidatus Giovannonibacteria 